VFGAESSWFDAAGFSGTESEDVYRGLAGCVAGFIWSVQPCLGDRGIMWSFMWYRRNLLEWVRHYRRVSILWLPKHMELG